ncbi:MAG TPA: ATP phosphoribosyltransferase regulatory subunit [Candidatus Limnocylindria bacterium]|jgi:ATP phosphoribosyltransferase regulatory subunit|nr:ATP phosphoribosyltransferase regulatory subunit [Candidatus Limnocylindria bacterium]
MEDQARPLGPPRGFRDVLPTEARELGSIERSLTDTFRSYGYMPLEPPMVEFSSGQSQERLIQFLDSDGSLVTLRPDLTTAVARLVAQRYRETRGALRLSYVAPIFREEPAMTASDRQLLQAGVELIGASGPLADADVLALLAEALECCGLRSERTTIHVGHLGVVRRLFAELDPSSRDLVLDDLRRGDLVGALSRARDAGMSGEGLGRAQEALGVIGRGIEELAGDDVSEIRHVIHLARERHHGANDLWGVPNIGLIPRLPYYTGVVFEALHPDVGVIASGGRYDLLIGAFGAPRPATGFAIDVLRLHRALFADGWRPAVAQPLFTIRPGADERLVMRCAGALRSAGLSVVLGDVAESAGVPVVAVDVVDEARVKLVDGRVVDIETLAREIRR